MASNQTARLKKLGIFNLDQAKGLGFDQPTVSRLVKAGELNRVGRGLYTHPKAPVSREFGFQLACAKFGPKAAVGGLSALFYYNLIEQVPQQTWILVPPSTLSRERGYRLMRTKTDLNALVLSKDNYRIVTVERAIVEGLRFATKIGERTAIGAAKRAIAQKLTTMQKIGKAANALGLTAAVHKFFEAIVA
jgi:predicted transcriptional regulator of viral defense system